MPTYAILGATGNAGSSILQLLLKDEQNKINVLVRSKIKLHKTVPRTRDSSQVTTFEGDIADIDNLASCIKGTKAVFLTVAATVNIPHCTIAQDTAHSVLSALEKIRQESPDVSLPNLVILSSAATDSHLERRNPRIVRYLLFSANYWLYIDLIAAEKLLRSNADWLTMTFVKPGGLVNDEQKGHELSTDRDQTFLGFLDLAAGMIEVADTPGDKWAQKSVSVLPSATDVRFEWAAPYILSRGLLFAFFPFLYPWLRWL